MVSVSVPDEPARPQSGIRPVNLRSDLAPLADLIEIAFAETMDSSGRAALREMRMLSHVGFGLGMVARMNELAMGINQGYVWVENGQLVGNVSVYSANWPRDVGSAWIIANVAVHPDYRRRGIARRLMQASLEMIRGRGGDSVILQVDHRNDSAHHLYRTLGFRDDGVWTLWRRQRSARLPIPHPDSTDIYIRRRRRAEWRTEYDLARRIRSEMTGGLGWLRPLHHSYFRVGFSKTIGNMLSLRHNERLVISSGHERSLHAALWVESGMSTSSRLTLLVDPSYRGLYDEALLNHIVRRMSGNALSIEHPAHDDQTNTVLERYRFYRHRTVIHMRWDGR